MKKISFIFILAAFLLMPFALSMSYEDLADTYDYDYSSGIANVTSISIERCDAHCRNLTLAINLSVEPGNYDVAGFYDGKTAEYSRYFFDSNGTISLVFFPEFRLNASDFWLKISKDGNLVYFSKAGKINLSQMSFEMPKITIIADSKINGAFVIDAAIKNITQGDYEVKAYLKTEDETVILVKNMTFAGSGDDDFAMEFVPESDGEFSLTQIDIGNNTIYLNYTTANYSFSRLNFTGEQIIDGDLAINFSSETNSTLTFYLFDSFEAFIASAESNSTIVTFNGTMINNSGLNGPYAVRTEINGRTYGYITGYYNYPDFGEVQKEQSTPIISAIISETKNKVSKALGSVSGFFEKDADNINETEKTNSSKTMNADLPNTSITNTKSNVPKDKNSTWYLNNIIPQMNFLTGNAVSDGQKSGSDHFILISLITLIVGISSFFMIRRLRNQ